MCQEFVIVIIWVMVVDISIVILLAVIFSCRMNLIPWEGFHLYSPTPLDPALACVHHHDSQGNPLLPQYSPRLSL